MIPNEIGIKVTGVKCVSKYFQWSVMMELEHMRLPKGVTLVVFAPRNGQHAKS